MSGFNPIFIVVQVMRLQGWMLEKFESACIFEKSERSIMFSAETIEVMERMKEAMGATYISATNRGRKPQQGITVSRSSVAAIQIEKFGTLVPIQDDMEVAFDSEELRVLGYLLRHCEGEVIDRIKGKLFAS